METIDAGELALGLSLLIENLDEFEIFVTTDEKHELRALAEGGGVEQRFLSLLDELELSGSASADGCGS